jgi:hypothetical protein
MPQWKHEILTARAEGAPVPSRWMKRAPGMKTVGIPFDRARRTVDILE